MRNKLLKAHFLKPKNMGRIENPGFEAIVKSDTCNDIVKMTASIDRNGIIKDIKTQVFGCGYSIAGASFFTETAKGKDALKIIDKLDDEIEQFKKDVPERNISCIRLSIKAFQVILDKYMEKRNGRSD